MEHNTNGALTVRDERATAAATRGDQEIAVDVSPLALIKFALQSNTPAAELKELVALAEHVEERNARKEFFAALRRFQKACPPIKKNKTAKITTSNGPGYSYKYAELDEIERHVKPYLDAEELSYNFDTTVEGNGAMLTNICTLRHVGGHSEPSRFTLPTSSKSAMTDQQRFSAANNFAKRQTLANVLGISISDKEVPDDEVDPETLSEDQVTEIDELIDESGADRAKFLRYMGVAAITEIKASDYPAAKAALAQRMGKKKS